MFRSCHFEYMCVKNAFQRVTPQKTFPSNPRLHHKTRTQMNASKTWLELKLSFDSSYQKSDISSRSISIFFSRSRISGSNLKASPKKASYTSHILIQVFKHRPFEETMNSYRFWIGDAGTSVLDGGREHVSSSDSSLVLFSSIFCANETSLFSSSCLSINDPPHWQPHLDFSVLWRRNSKQKYF